jgi:hypothetical protein
MHLRIQGIPKITPANSKAAKSDLGFPIFHFVVRVELFRMVAHLFHPPESFVAFIAHVHSLLMGNLLMLHQFLYLAKFAAAGLALVPPEQVSARSWHSVHPSTFCTSYPRSST